MKKGKFEAGRRSTAEGSAEQVRGGFPWLLVLIPVLVLAAVGTILYLSLSGREPTDGTGQSGFPKEELLAQYQNLSHALEQRDMVLTILPQGDAEDAEPIRLTVPAGKSHVRVDLKGLEADLEAGVGKISRKRYLVDPEDYVSLDHAALRELAEQTHAQWAQSYVPSSVGLRIIPEGEREQHVLCFNVGREGRELSADEIYETLTAAYLAGELNPEMHYEVKVPEPLDVAEIWQRYSTPPQDARLNEKTFEIIHEVPGFGFHQSKLERMIRQAEPGKGYTLTLDVLEPTITSAYVEASLYADILGEAHTPHSWVNDRTNNLILACEAIDGTVVMPGEVFSFNETVGQRTEAKGYREATAYVGGNSVPEIGGGVCQVASTIYYAVLQADLESVERHAHTYLVTYVPHGMDAAIYWGQLDYQFKNTSPRPIKIEAGVSDGKVHIILRGTEWKNYTVKLSYEILEEIPYETTERYVYDDSYAPGDTIVTPYTGYRVSTYKSLYDLEGNFIEKVHITNSRYAKRDKVIAVLPPKPAETTPTEPTGDD